MTKVIGQQQFSQLWSQFQTTNPHLFHGEGQLKPSISTDEVQQLIATVTEDSPDDAQLFGVQHLMTEHADAFDADDLQLFRMEIDELGLDLSRFAVDTATTGLTNAAKRFAATPSEVGDKALPFVVEAPLGHDTAIVEIETSPDESLDLAKAEDIRRAVRFIVEQDDEMYSGAALADRAAKLTTKSKVRMTRLYQISNDTVTLNDLVNTLSRIEHGGSSRIPLYDVLDDIKRELGFERLVIEIEGDGWDLRSEEGIFAAVRAIVEQDKAFYKEEDIAQAAKRIQTKKVCALRSYRFGDKVITLNGLFDRVRIARGFTARASRSLSNGTIIRQLQESMGVVFKVFEISALEGYEWDLETEEGLFVAMRAVVCQDAKFYPGDTPAEKASRLKQVRERTSRSYRFGDEEATLGALIGRVGRLRKNAGRPKSEYIQGAVIEDVKTSLGWRDDAMAIPTPSDFTWGLDSPEGIVRAIDMIIRHDSVAYPHDEYTQNVASVASGGEVGARRYRLGAETKAMSTLVNRYRRLVMRDKGEGVEVSVARALFEIKTALGWKSEAMPIDISPDRLDTEEDITRAIEAIVHADTEMYPGETIAEAIDNMSVNPECTLRRYLFGYLEISLHGLLSRIRKARGLSLTDYKKLPIRELVHDVKVALGWKETDENVFTLTLLEGEKWDLDTEEGVIAVIRRIIAQDKKSFPEDDVSEAAARIVPSNIRPRYRFGSVTLSIHGLLGRIRAARGYRSDDFRALPYGHIAWEVREALGWRSTAFELQAPKGMEWDLKTEEGTVTAIKTFVEQDHEFYPGDTLAEKAESLGRDMRRQYRFGYEIVSLGFLLDRIRVARGFKVRDQRALPYSKIIQDIKEQLGWKTPEDAAQEFVRSKGVEGVISLLGESPAQLRTFLSLFYGDELDEEASMELVRTFSDLGLYTEIHQSRRPGEDLEILVRAMFVRRDCLAQFSERDRERAIGLLQFLMGKHFEEDFDAAAAEIEHVVQDCADANIQQLLNEVVERYRSGRTLNIAGVKTKLMLYQKLAVQFLLERERAILGDAPGLGKTLESLAAAAELRARGEVKKVLIVAPAAVKTNWEEQISEHLHADPDRKVIKIEGQVDEKAAQVIASHDAHYVIVNYEYLRGKSKEELAPLLGNVDLVIVDEAQNMSNPSEQVQQAEAVRNIKAPRRWLATATPYYSHPEHIFSLLKYLNPGRYEGFKEFKAAFTTDLMGLRLLHGELEGVMLRRSVAEALGEYRPNVPLAAQGVKMPRKDVVPSEDEGYYDISRSQVELLRELSQDIRGWMIRRGYSSKMTHFTHLRLLYNAIVDPSLLGEDVDSPMYEELDRIVMKRMAQGKKVLIYGHRASLVSRIQRRYAHLGAVKFNSTVSTKRREENLRSFETDPETRIMVAGIKSGGVGLNIKAADTIVNVERHFDHSAKIQSEGRPQRLSPENPKESYEVITLVGRYPEFMVAGERDAAFRAFMEIGTPSEILEARLSDLDRIYRLVMDGMMTENEAKARTMKILVQGFAGLSTIDTKEIDKVRRKKAFGKAGAFYRLWDSYRDDAEMRARVERLTALYVRTRLNPRALADALADSDDIQAEDLDWIMAPFAEPNRYLRDKAAEALPLLVRRLHEADISLHAQAEKFGGVSNRSARVVLPLMSLLRTWEDPQMADIVRAILADIETLSSSQSGQALGSLMTMAVSLGERGNGEFRSFVLHNRDLITDKDVSVVRRANALERIALLAEFTSAGYEDVLDGTYAGIDDLADAIKNAQRGALAREFGIEWNEENESRIARLHGAWGDFRPLMGLLNGMQRAGDEYRDEIAQLKEVFVHAVRGDLREWRNEQTGDREAGNKIAYLENHPDFWRQWSQEDETRHDEVIVEAGMQRHVLSGEYERLVRLLQLSGDVVSQEWFVRFVRAGDLDKQSILKQLLQNKKTLARVARQSDIDEHEEELIARYVFEDEQDPASAALRRVTRLWKLSRALISLDSWRKGKKDAPLDARAVVNVLRQQALNLAGSTDEAGKQLREQFDRMRHFLESSGKERKYRNVRVYDTDDPNIIMRLGALAPDMINCFNHHGNPTQNHVLTGALGSRNFRVVVVEVDGRIRAAAPVKVRKTGDEHPAIFLERGLFSGRYNFEREMLEHLEQKKARRMELQPLVARQVMKPQPGDITVYSTGNYSRNEYAEALFGVRESDAVYHSARVVFDPDNE